MGDTRYLTEIPSSLKQLARLVVRGFYTIEDALIIDMLVRNPCKLNSYIFTALQCLIVAFDFRHERRRPL